MKMRSWKFTGVPFDTPSDRESDNRKIARKAAAEGFVLLKNEDNFLPFSKKKK